MGTRRYDFRLALRALARAPRFALMSILLLALGIGVTTAIYSVFHGVLIEPLAFPDSQELVRLWPGTQVDKLIVDRLSNEMGSLDAVTGYQMLLLPVSSRSGPAEVVRVAKVGVEHFRVVGEGPALGRGFRADEAGPGESRVVVLSNGLWHRRYGADESVIGGSLRIDGVEHTIIGVMPSGFHSLEPGVELWAPLVIDPSDQKDYLGSFYLTAVGRLAPGATVSQAGAEAQALIQRLRSTYPKLITEELASAARAVPLKEDVVHGLRPTLILLQSIVVLVLLVACGNMANLVRTRVLSRTRDLAVRAALGAGRGQLLEIVTFEILAIAVVGGLCGLLFAYALLDFSGHVLAHLLPPGTGWHMGANVVAVGFGVALVGGLVVAAFGVRGALRFSFHEELKESGGGGSAGRSRRRANRGLVVAQVAMASLLLVGSGLLLRSWLRLQDVDPGFEGEHRVTFRVDLPQAEYPEPGQMTRFYDELLRRLDRLPGIESAGGVHLLPLSVENWSFPYVAEGHQVTAEPGAMVSLPVANFRIATPGYFRTMGIDLAAGRSFDSRDGADAPGVGLINRTLAEELWGVQQAPGYAIQLFGQGGPIFHVVGVVEDVADRRLDVPPQPTIYRPYAQWPVPSMHLVVHSDLAPAALAPPLRTAVAEVGPGVPIDDVQPMADVVAASMATERLTSLLVAGFAVLALLLALSGLYATNSYAVAQRTREFGVRLAMGADRGQVLMQVVREGLGLSAAGVVLGMAAAWAGMRLLESRLYATSPLDPGVYAVVAVVVVAASILSILGPARKAMGIDPTESLRYE